MLFSPLCLACVPSLRLVVCCSCARTLYLSLALVSIHTHTHTRARADHKVEDLSIKLQFNTYDKWTKALKYMLTNIKWLVAISVTRR